MPTLNEGQQIRYQKILKAPHLKTHQLVRLENLATTQSKGKLVLRMRNVACDSIVFTVKTVEYTSENDYYWYGIIQGDKEGLCLTGTIMLIAKNGEKYGQVILDDRTFEYQELGNNLQVLSEHNNKHFAKAGCGVTAKTPKSSTPLLPPNNTARTGCQGSVSSFEPVGTIRVLVLSTQAAFAAEPSAGNRANFAIQQTNQIFANSRILPQNARLVLAGTDVLNFTETLLPTFDPDNP